MTFTIEINNPHYYDILCEMAQSAGMAPAPLVSAMVTRAIDDYAEEKKAWQNRYVSAMIPEETPFE